MYAAFFQPERKAQLGKTEAELQQIIQERLQKLKDIKHSAELSKRDAKREIADSMQVFTALVRSIEKSQVEVIDVIEKKQKAAERDGEAEVKLKRIQQYAVDVTLDPDTAHPNLILSEDGKQVRCGETVRNLPDNPKRFDRFAIVLGKDGFSSGRFYYEVTVKGKTKWTLGVARESIDRKRNISLSPEDGLWTVLLRDGNVYKASTYPHFLLSLKEKPMKVGVFVDYEEGQVSFYDVEARSHIYSFTGCAFTEKLYPLFSPCNHAGGKNLAPLIISPVNHTD
ncbi:E3 ubiquitin-protein ligase TRIM39-like [Oncorhynchus keta]|uniref:E3 ubiquitin-protein ligase TRIM39-like n=1 Tax=Oncorhynchus keta TaxID=8018 RepID=UPI00227AD952|nr:E3 ubiquitin-protein ligase TRIM39-like [Oncorhynchus keta]